MTKTDLNKKKLPDAPGVYFFLGTRKEILYIGKATLLQNRVRSYFSHDLVEKRSPLIAKMIDEARNVEWTETDSVLEALILETNLIRTHKPRYNTISKDDKSYNHLVITNEEWPRVLVVRAKDLTSSFTENEIMYEFGPFPSGSLFKEALKIIRKLFKFYDTTHPIGSEKSRVVKGMIDFNRQIGLYPPVVKNHRSQTSVMAAKKEYMETIRHITLFFEGRKAEIISDLTATMMQKAKQQEFEKAASIKKKIFALNHIQDVALLKTNTRFYRDERTARIEAYDIAHFQGEDMVGVMTVVEGGEPTKSEYRKFKIQSLSGSNDPAALKEILERRLQHDEWPFPQVIVVDGSTAQKNAAEYVLKKLQVLIPVVAVGKDDPHKPVRLIGSKKLLAQFQNDILLANAESHRFAIAFHREKFRKRKLT